MTDPDSTAEDQWPLVRLDVSDLPPTDGARRVNDTLLAAAGRGEPFAAVLRMPAITERPKVIGGVSERVRMLKQLRPRLKQHCLGLAFVVPIETQAVNAKAIRAGTKLWGCPTFATDDPDAATAWAYERLADERGEG